MIGIVHLKWYVFETKSQRHTVYYTQRTNDSVKRQKHKLVKLIFVQISNFVICTFCFSFLLAPQESLIPTNTNAAVDQKRASTLTKIPEENSPVFGFTEGNVCCRVIPTVSMFEIHIYNNIQFWIFISLFYMPICMSVICLFAHVPHTTGKF